MYNDLQPTMHGLYAIDNVEKCKGLSAVAEYADCGTVVRKILSSIPGHVKIMTYQIDSCRFIAWYLALMR